MIPTIDFACTANQGRSPVAELVARNYIAKIGAGQDLEAISSGSHAAAIQAGENPVPVMLGFIELARGRTENLIYTAVDEHGIDEAIKSGDEKAIKAYFHMAEETFHEEEMASRAEALPYFGIEGKVKEQGEQTVADQSRIVVLPMAESNKKAIVSIYEAAGFQPPEGIVLLGDYVSPDKRIELPDAFGRGRDAHFNCIEKIVECVPKAVDRAYVALR